MQPLSLGLNPTLKHTTRGQRTPVVGGIGSFETPPVTSGDLRCSVTRSPVLFNPSRAWGGRVAESKFQHAARIQTGLLCLPRRPFFQRPARLSWVSILNNSSRKAGTVNPSVSSWSLELLDLIIYCSRSVRGSAHPIGCWWWLCWRLS